MLKVIIWAARNEDAAILAAAERATAETPGLLVSRPSELIPENFEKKIAELAKIGRYVSERRPRKSSAVLYWIRCRWQHFLMSSGLRSWCILDSSDRVSGAP